MIPDICILVDKIFCHFRPFFAFTSLPSLTIQKIKFWKNEKKSGDIIILHICTRNDHHMLYCSWNTECGRCHFYFSFWAIFCPFTPLTAQKIKNEKNTWIYYHFTHMYQKLWSHDVQFLRYGAHEMNGWTDKCKEGLMDR